MINDNEMKVLQFLSEHPTELKENCGKWYVQTVSFHDMCLFFKDITLPSIAVSTLISKGFIARGKITSEAVIAKGVSPPFFYALTLKGKDLMRKARINNRTNEITNGLETS